MSLSIKQIDRAGSRASRKWAKNQRNRKIRRVKSTQIPCVKYRGWDN